MEKSIIGNTHASNVFIPVDSVEKALTYYVVSNKSTSHATVHIIAGTATASEQKIIAIIPVPPKSSYYSVGQFRLIMDNDKVSHLYVKEVENTSTPIDSMVDVMVSYFTKE